MRKKKSLSERIEQVSEVLDELSNIGDMLSSSFDNKELSYKFLDILDRLITVEYAGLYLWNEEEKKLELFVSKGFTEQDKIEAEKTAMNRHVGWVYKNQEILNIPDASKDKRSITGKRSFKVGSRVWIPIIIDGRSVGSFGLASGKKHGFNQNAISALNFVGKIAAITYFNIEYKKNLLAREGHLKNIIDGNMDGHVMIDHKGIISSWNKNATSIFGWEADEVIGKSLTETIIPTEHQKGHKAGMKSYLKTGESKILNQRVNLEAINKDGNKIPIELIVNRLDYKGNIFFSGFIRDISLEQEHMEIINSFAKNLKEEVDQKTKEVHQLSTFPKNNPNPIVEMSFSCDLLFYNDAAVIEFPELDLLGGEHPFCLYFKPHIKPILEKGINNDITLDMTLELNNKKYNCKIYLIQALQKARFYLNDVTEREEHIKLIETINKDLNDSINYAKHLQQAIFPSNNEIHKDLEAFILYSPKDIVSGDFYTRFDAPHRDGSIIVAVADCTGHGVPGAMLSFICYDALATAIKELQVPDPAAILNRARELIIETFKKSKVQVNDGMDISMCVINPKTKELVFAGANSPLYVVKKIDDHISENDTANKTHYLGQVKGDSQPIGYYFDQLPFTNKTLNLSSGDSIYLFSDGYADQFGGSRDKKFGYRRFRELLLESHFIPIEKQKSKLEDILNEWKGEKDQIDDILVLGIRL